MLYSMIKSQRITMATQWVMQGVASGGISQGMWTIWNMRLHAIQYNTQQCFGFENVYNRS